MPTIVKVQVCIDPPGAPSLVYAEGRTRLRQMVLPFDIRLALDGDLKGHFQADWNGAEWIIGKRVEDQSW
jgi:hypothetical protein